MSSQESSSTGRKKVNQLIVTIFGLSEITALFVASMNTQHFSFFITDILLVSPAVMGTILIITRSFDIGTILISSVVEEKFNLKWGKYRSWLLLMIPAAAIVGILQYAGIGGSVNSKLAISAICYVLFFGFFNFGRTAQMALLNTIGKTPEERAALSARKAQFAQMSGIILNATFMPIALFFSGATSKTDVKLIGFFLTVVIFQCVYFIAQMGLFKASKPYDLPVEHAAGTKKPKLTGLEMCQQIFKNPPLMFLLLAETCKTVCNTLVLSSAVYYFKVVAQDLTYQSYFSTALSVAGFAGALFAGQFLVKRLSKKTVYMLGFAGPVVAMLLARFVSGNNTLVFFSFMCAAWFFYTGIATCGPAMFGDCVEYGKYKIGKEARAFIMGLYTLPIKVGVLLAGGISGYLLAGIGYSADAAVTDSLKTGLFNIVSFAPAVVMGIGLICAILYPLTNKRVKEIMEKNAEK